MTSRRVFLKDGAVALVTLGFAPSFLTRTAFAAGAGTRPKRLIGIPIIAYLSGEHLWRVAFMLGAAFSVACAVAWFGIVVEQPLDAHPQPATLQ